MRALFLSLFILCQPRGLTAAEGKGLLGVVGIIRAGTEDAKSLVLFKLKSTQKTVLIPVAGQIADTPFTLLRVTRQGAIIRSESGREELIELEERPLAEKVMSPLSSAAEKHSVAEDLETPLQQELVWPKTSDLKPPPKLEVRTMSETEPTH